MSSSSAATGSRPDVEHEAVELGLGQRVGALLLDRVLRGEHEERLRQLVRRAAGGDLALLHRLEQRGLRLGRGPVDLVGEHDVGEDRPALELEEPLARGGSSSITSVPVMSDGMRSGVNWMRLKLRSSDIVCASERDQHRLRQPRHAHEQAVAAREDRDHQLVDDIVLVIA
jgi:hypothetical protein